MHTQPSRQYHVCIFSTVHIALDNRLFYREALSLYKAGYKVTLIAVHDKFETRQGIEIIPLPRIRRALRPFLWWKLLRLLKATKANIFQFCDPELLFIAPLLRFLTRKPVIYDVLESTSDFIDIKEDIPYFFRRFFSWFFSWLEPALAKYLNGLVFADDQIASTFQKILCPKTTLFNFPEKSFLDNAYLGSKNKNHKHPIVLYLGGLKRPRGTNLMINAFELVLREIPDACLYLIGPFAPTSLEKEIHKEIYSRNMSSNVIITGAVPFSDIGYYLEQASIGWIPFQPISKYQKNIPTKLFEYMAYAIPVVCSDLLSIHPFIIDQQTGILVKADDPQAHAQAIVELLKNPIKAKQIGEKSQLVVMKQYRWDMMEIRLLDLYKSILQNNS